LAGALSLKILSKLEVRIGGWSVVPSHVAAMMTSDSVFDKRIGPVCADSTVPQRPGATRVGKRLLGTMVTYGYPDIELDDELRLARRIGASVLEILPLWNRLLDP